MICYAYEMMIPDNAYDGWSQRGISVPLTTPTAFQLFCYESFNCYFHFTILIYIHLFLDNSSLVACCIAVIISPFC